MGNGDLSGYFYGIQLTVNPLNIVKGVSGAKTKTVTASLQAMFNSGSQSEEAGRKLRAL